MRVRLGTRGSRLARAQSELVAERLRDLGLEVEVVPILTKGDARPPGTTPGEGVFVTAIAEAILRREVDLGVHSAKDVPLAASPGLTLVAFPERADPRDALVTRGGSGGLADLAPGAAVGTDSPRRAAFLRAFRSDLRVVPLHGNVDTRLKRVDAGEVDAIVVAAAGLDRLGRQDRVDERIDPEVIPPAPAQGALAIQGRSDADELLSIVARLDNPAVRAAVEAERTVLEATGGTCRAPVGALAEVRAADFTLVAGGVGGDGQGKRIELRTGPRAEAAATARAVGRWLAAEVRLT